MNLDKILYKIISASCSMACSPLEVSEASARAARAAASWKGFFASCTASLSIFTAPLKKNSLAHCPLQLRQLTDENAMPHLLQSSDVRLARCPRTDCVSKQDKA